ncbi:hypothetical protein AVEN_220816-1 [Araneus ventricosus]|uniref:Uncharacterized protein n=1 Tax=Araneus ventricosus TaxID=182803 RepID=A0A4Y2FUG3_ARAVE|nr:hypothetical protein AVEN_220816-1 [Araneus ventricosus]
MNAEPFLNVYMDFIVVCKPATLHRFLQRHQTLSPIHIRPSSINVRSTSTFGTQKLNYSTLCLFGGIHDTALARFCLQKRYTAAKSNTVASPDLQLNLQHMFESSTSQITFAVPLSFEPALY